MNPSTTTITPGNGAPLADAKSHPIVTTPRFSYKVLKAPSLGLFLFMCGFHGIFLMPLLFPTSKGEAGGEGVMRYYYLSYALVFFGSLIESLAARMWLWRAHPIWAWCAVSSIILMAWTGLAGGEPIVDLIRKSFVFSCLVLVGHVALRARNWHWLWLTIFIQAIIGIIFTAHHFLTGGMARIDIFELKGYYFLLRCNDSGPLLFFMLGVMVTKHDRYLAVASFFMRYFKALLTYNRLSWLLVPFQILLLVRTYIRFIGTGKVIRRLVVLGLVLFVVMFLVQNLYRESIEEEVMPVLTTAVEGTMDRFLERGSLQATIQQGGRLAEAKAVLSTMEGFDWLIGQGFAGSWSSPSLFGGKERDAAHISWIAYLFWGGVLFLFVMVTTLVWTMRLLFSKANMITVSLASYMLVMFIQATSFNITAATNRWVLFCLILGVVAHDIVYEGQKDHRQG